MGRDKVGFRLHHDPRRDLPEAPHIRKQERHLAPRFLRSSGDESATRPPVGVHFAPSVMMRRSTYGAALPNGSLQHTGRTSLGAHAKDE
jgi:hypothetical protein